LRAEDKEVDGRELEQDLQLEHSELEKSDEEELPAAMLDEVRDLAREQQGTLLAAIQTILARELIVIDALRLPAHELHALECLKAAVDGKDTKVAQFVFASDRRHLLEQALAVLQPNLAIDDAAYAKLVERVSGLRRDLANLEDAQDELLDGHHREIAKAAGAPDDKPKPEVPEGAPSSLYGPEVAEPARPSSSLYGAEVVEPAARSTLSDGPAVSERAPARSTLSDGPPAAEPVPPATTLGDPAEIAAVEPTIVREAEAIPVPPEPAAPPEAPAKKPWWKRPFG